MSEYKNQLKKRFEVFKDKYSHKYSPKAWEYIEDNFFDMIHSNETPDILMQVYSELDITPSSAMFYRKHLKLLKSKFPIDGNILEIGSGRIPAFANLIASEQNRIKKGTITIYDPLLVELTPKYHNMTLHKEYFNLDTDVSMYDLLVGIMPCEATESILESAISNKKDFYVAMCGCVHSPWESMYPFGFSTSPEIYQQQVISKAKKLMKEYNMGELGVTKLRTSPINYPILYNRQK